MTVCCKLIGGEVLQGIDAPLPMILITLHRCVGVVIENIVTNRK